MKEVAMLLAGFLLIGLTWRKFSAGARIALLGVIIAVLAVYLSVTQV